MKNLLLLSFIGLLPWLLLSCQDPKKPAEIHEIKAYNLDFNWGDGGPNAFAAPGLWADASPAEHIRWYKDMGVNTIQTFIVSCNGYAWYKNSWCHHSQVSNTIFCRKWCGLGTMKE
ncbi:MAG: hypothetical protein U5K79_25440 [Cyclobacteriaceae bacterium]|nr:hypothetical protein [Cyclobacteriaceae bacterium]